MLIVLIQFKMDVLLRANANEIRKYGQIRINLEIAPKIWCTSSIANERKIFCLTHSIF